MKKQILSFMAIALVGGSVVLTSCKKADTTAPVLTLTGDAAMTLDLGATFTDQKASAKDDKDGDISSTVTVSGNVNTNQVGTYTLTYSVSDKAGNAATPVTRTVKVKSDRLAGTYAVVDVVTGGTTANNGTWNYSVGVSQSSTDYNKIIISNFGGLDPSTTVYAMVEGANMTIPSQTATANGASLTISGTGTYDGATAKITNVTYSAGSVYGNGNATYTKQ